MVGPLKTLTLVAAAGLALFGDGARATEPEIWSFQCMEDEDSGEKICTTEISANDDGRDFLIYFVHNKGGKSSLVVTGDESEFSGTTIKVDLKDPLQTDKCDVGMCYFELEKSRLLLKQFRRGKSARVSITDGKAKLILDRDITLRGFSAAYAKF
jgi:invasion protein IalB